MAFHDDLADQAVEVVLRVREDQTDRTSLKSGDVTFETWVVPLEDNHYRLEDLWFQQPFKMMAIEGLDPDVSVEEQTPGGLAFRDIFLAQRLPDESLLFDRVVQKANWRIDNWMLPLSSESAWRYLTSIVERIEAHGGCIEPDPWFVNWLWTFMPSEADYDPTSDINETINNIPREELYPVARDYLEKVQGSDEEET